MATVMTLDTEYQPDMPGPYCQSHRSVYCVHVQDVIREREDRPLLADVMGRSVSRNGEQFHIALPIYPELCIWDIVSYKGVEHPAMGLMAERTGEDKEGHNLINRLLVGESAADLAKVLRDNYEEDEDVLANIQSILSYKPRIEKPTNIPRCTAQGHSMKYQNLLNQVFDPKTLRLNWSELRDQAFGMMWTFEHYRQCAFCWTKSRMADAIRVSPTFAVESTTTDSWDDLVPSPVPGRRASSPPERTG